VHFAGTTVESGNPAKFRREVLDCGSPLPLWHRAWPRKAAAAAAPKRRSGAPRRREDCRSPRRWRDCPW